MRALAQWTERSLTRGPRPERDKTGLLGHAEWLRSAVLGAAWAARSLALTAETAPLRPLTARAAALENLRWRGGRPPEKPHRQARDNPSWVVERKPDVHRIYLLREDLGLLLTSRPLKPLTRFTDGSNKSRISSKVEFVDLARHIVTRRAATLAAVEHGLTNARVVGRYTSIRLVYTVGFGYPSSEPLIARAMRHLGGHPARLPGRDPRISQPTPGLMSVV